MTVEAIGRCWRAVEDEGLLLVEHSLSFHRWVFYLVSPVLDEAGRCAALSLFVYFDLFSSNRIYLD